MREYLFRGKTTAKDNPKHSFNSVWVYGDLIISGGGYYIHPKGNLVEVDGEIGKTIIMHKVIPETVGQYTGAVGKNAQRIFDGDIVIIGKANKPVYVVLRDYQWLFVNPKISPYYRCRLDDDMKANYKVIGNIHDNPELLEVAE